MKLDGKHIVVAGLGKTGEALVRFLADRGAEVTVTDEQSEDRLAGALGRLGGLSVKSEFGGFRTKTFTSADLVIASPGIPHAVAPMEAARAAGVPVIGEIELAYRFIKAPIIGVTGTNGKSTTTRLIGRILSASGKNVFVGGNIGTPLIACAYENEETDVVVAEISSYQLDTIVEFRPAVGVLLNITPDHLDRYTGFEEYGKSKGRMFENQNSGDTAIYNAADPMVAAVTESIASRKCPFNAVEIAGCGAAVGDGGIDLLVPGSGEIHIPAEKIAMKGRHNLENTAAAVLAALFAGATVSGVFQALADFMPDPHRLEYLGTVNGVAFYDDSKATNTDAVVRAIEAVGPPVLLIAGGRDKGGGYENLRRPVEKAVKTLIVLGEAADNICRDLGGIVETLRAASMSDAVRMAAERSVPGDKVLLSPACSSFDMYESYSRRGDDFQMAVKSLREVN